jgi:phosphoribosylanthranilate isomerase
MISVKICGITSARDAEMVVAAGARAIGFVFYGLSPRAISPASAREIGRAVPRDIKKVGVFVNTRADVIEDIADRAGLDLVQLSGDESPSDVRFQVPRRVVKALRPRSVRDLARIVEWKDVAQSIMIDSGGPGEDQYGGSGVLVDFALAKQAKTYGKPIILAGGLNAATAVAALRAVEPNAIDVCSGVESEPGKKDPKKVKSLFDALWRFDEELRGKGGGLSGRFRTLGSVAKTLEPPRPKAEPDPGPEPVTDLIDEIPGSDAS